MDLPVVDPDASVDEQAQLMAQACETIGFFQLPLSVVDRQVADDAWHDAAAFFALPEAKKNEVAFPEPGYPYGYSSFGFETLAKSLDDGSPSGPDLKESLSVGPDAGASVLRAMSSEQAWIRSPSLWPDEPARLRRSWKRYYQALAAVSEQLMRVMAVALDLDPDYFTGVIDQPITSMRALHYPALTDTHQLLRATESPSLRAGPHSDYGTLTILRTDDVAGLEIVDAHGRWQPVTPNPDMFVVNLGDSIAQWTNDRWRSTIHRVALTNGAARQSFAFFHMANWDATISCLPTCLSPGEEPRHAPVQAGPWLMRKFTATVS